MILRSSYLNIYNIYYIYDTSVSYTLYASYSFIFISTHTHQTRKMHLFGQTNLSFLNKIYENVNDSLKCLYPQLFRI